ncbi:Glutaredoxin domain-containing cysteine-rich protein [Thalictrum thalictroides]|uniref:Glutaredoxin domain-containing cysteine-rich protein n=1 Tax=Thalictrum thalictroides TaxID=46969 RepID=A0A7J6WN35_THATH|nr:Glutaredoxin domain-containing cysteine-rich protein [Thalictrum thalictroides]
MGCAKSKEARCEHCKKPYSSKLRSPSSLFHRALLHKGDNASVTTQSTSRRLSDAHNVSVVSPSSNTSGINGNSKNYFESPQGKKSNNNSNRNSNVDKGNQISMDSKGKADYNKMNETVQQLKVVPPTRIPSGEAETINTWELMEGLEDNNNSSDRPNYKDTNDDFSFPVATDTVPINKLTSRIQENDAEPKPMWLQMAANDSILTRSIVSDFDPEIISTFRKALEELSPRNALFLRSPGSGRIPSPGHQRLYSTGSVRAPSPGHQRLISTGSMDILTSPGHDRWFSKDSIDSKDFDNEIAASKLTPCGENKVVLYFTSLRGVRKTYEDCCRVKVILKGLGAKVDERDVSMHYGYREELRQLLGTEGIIGKLPRVFVKGKYIGGAEELRRMLEDGELEKVIEGCEMVEEGGGGVCETCGDTRFVICDMCSGSCKIYIEGKDDGDGREENDENVGFQRCPYCNENGIVRCSSCCSS